MPKTKFLKMLGPGFITGASDNDPSGIATYSQTGAQLGYGQLWTVLFMLPLMIAIQEACARIGACKGKGLAQLIKENYSPQLAFLIVGLLLIANIITIGADLGAMAAAINLILPLSHSISILIFVIIIVSLQVFMGYEKYAKILKWFCLSLFAYPATLFLINIPFVEVVQATFIPHIEFNYHFLFLLTAVFGTTISPYMFFWQASQEVEESKNRNLHQHIPVPVNKQDILRIRIDTLVGMFLSQLTSWSIIVIAATVLNAKNITNINNAADVAKMLEPLVQNFPQAGLMAKLIFSIGIIGLGMLAIPILATSASYAICELYDLRRGINHKFNHAKSFYLIMIISIGIGVLINILQIDSIKMLIYAAVINGIIAVPMVLIITLLAGNKKIMGQYKSGLWSQIFLWLTFLGMFISAISMFFKA